MVSAMNNAIILIKRQDLRLNELPEGIEFKILNQSANDFLVKIPYRNLKHLNYAYELKQLQGPIALIQSMFRNVALYLGILFFVVMMFIHSRSIKTIDYNAYTPYNAEIQTIIEGYLTKVFGLNFFTGDLKQLNFELRKTFSHFEWIDVQRQGTRLKVTILEPTMMNKQTEVIGTPGDLVARTSGWITAYKVKHGVLLVTRDQYVKAGDVLVSGNLTIKRGGAAFYIAAEGDVYAQVHYAKTVEVPAKMVQTEYTGRVQKQKALELLGLKWRYKNDPIKYTDYDVVERTKTIKIWRFPTPIRVKEYVFYEKSDIITIYDKSTAKDYALSSLMLEITKHFRPGDTIVESVLLSESENRDGYRFNFLIITNENIAEFRRSNVDE